MNQFTPVTRPKPPYLVGILCVIPVIGGFVGLGLIISGFFRYRDKWLVIIGTIGIIYSIVFFSFMFHAMRNWEPFRKGFASISQIQLNGLVREIEFYRIQHGHYPDNLSQLTGSGTMISIEDPVQTFKSGERRFYHYQNLGDKYQLFSVGEDGIPHTSDDLYPDVAVTDSSGVGLIIKRQ